MRDGHDALQSERCGIALPQLTRRGFARVTGLTAGAVALGGAVGPGVAFGAASIPNPAPTSIVYVPHQDDDVLSFGLYIASQTQGGNDVHVVLYTDGSATGVCLPDANYGVCTANDEYGGGTVDDFVTARDAEFVASVTALGVKPQNIHIGTEGVRARDARTTLSYTDEVIRYWVDRYPRATHVAYSWIDNHTDHANAGRALRNLVASGGLPATQALFAIARWYWQYDYPELSDMLITRRNELRAAGGFPTAVHMFRTSHAATNAAFVEAIRAYTEPTNIGYRSVPLYLDTAKDDPASLIHGYASERYSTRLAVIASRTGPNLRIGGAIRFTGFPGYGDLGNPQGLAQALDPSKIANPLQNSVLTVQLLDRTNRVVQTAKVKVKTAGRFDLIVRVPNAVITSVRVTFDGTPNGAGPSTAVKAVTGAPTVKRVSKPTKTTPARRSLPAKSAPARR